MTLFDRPAVPSDGAGAADPLHPRWDDLLGLPAAELTARLADEPLATPDDPARLDAAVDDFRRALDPTGHAAAMDAEPASRVRALLAAALVRRAGASDPAGRADDLREASDLVHGDGLRASQPELHALLSAWLVELTDRTSDLTTIDETIALQAGNSAARPTVQDLVGRADLLAARFRVTQDPADIAAALALVGSADDLVADDPVRRLQVTTTADRVHVARFEASGDVDDLHRSLAAGESALALESRHPGTWDVRAGRLSHRWMHLYELTGEEDALRRSVDLSAAALAASSSTCGHHRTIYRRDLSTRLIELYELVGETQVLDRAIGVAELAVTQAAPGEDRFRSEKALAAGLITRYRSGADQADLDRAILVLDVDRTDEGGAAPSDRPGDLAVALAHRWKDRGDDVDLDRAIALLQPYVEQVLTLPDGPGPDHDVALSNLGLFLNERFRLRGDREDFDRSIHYATQCLGMYPAGHRRSAALSVILAARLLTSFQLSGDDAEANRAIELMRGVVDATLPSEPLHAARRSNLGVLLTAVAHHRTVAGQAGEAVPLLSEAIVHLREALAVGGAGHGQADATKALGHALLELHAATSAIGAPADPTVLDEAVDLLEQALTTRVGPDRADIESALARAILWRIDATVDHPDRARAQALAASALQRTPATSPHRREREELVASVG
jgi:hypothetical protein